MQVGDGADHLVRRFVIKRKALAVAFLQHRAVPGERTPGDVRDLGGFAVDQDDPAVLSEAPDVFRVEHRASSGRDHGAGEKAQLADDLLLLPAERRLAEFFKIRGDGAARPPDEDRVGIVKRQPQPARRQASDRAFSRARHPCENEIFLFFQQRATGFLRLFLRDLLPEEERGGFPRLRDQHIEPARRGDPALLCLEDKPGAEGVVDHVDHALEPREGGEPDRLSVRVREHPAGGGVDQDLRVGVEGDGVFVGEGALPAGAGDLEDLAGAGKTHRRRGGTRGASGAEDQRLFPGEGDPRAGEKSRHPGKVGVIAVKTPAPVYHRVDGADLRGGGVYPVEQGDHRFFIGDRHVDPAEVPSPEKVFQLLPPHLAKLVRVGGERGVYLGGKAVSQLFPDQSVFHGVTGER